MTSSTQHVGDADRIRDDHLFSCGGERDELGLERGQHHELDHEHERPPTDPGPPSAQRMARGEQESRKDHRQYQGRVPEDLAHQRDETRRRCSRRDQPEAQDPKRLTEHRSQPDECEQRAETVPGHAHHEHRTHRRVGEERQRQRDLVEGQVTDEVVVDQECDDEERGEDDDRPPCHGPPATPTTLASVMPIPRRRGSAGTSRHQILASRPTSWRIRAPDSSALGTKPTAPDDSMSAP